VKDFLSGVFLVLEDQFGVGDFVDLGPATGTVEEVTLRITRVRDLSGVVWYVRNGEILRVGNRSQGWTMATVDVPVAYNEDLDRVRRLVEQVGTRWTSTPGTTILLLVYAGVERECEAVRARLRRPRPQMVAARAIRGSSSSRSTGRRPVSAAAPEPAWQHASPRRPPLTLPGSPAARTRASTDDCGACAAS
jgi:hypothetical protein